MSTPTPTPKPTPKTLVTLSIAPYSASTPIDSLKSHVLAITHDGLVWGNSSYVDVGFGIQKLHQNVVIEDTVSLEDLQEEIEGLGNGEWVQSTDVEGMQKI
ncbi:hypothetical protein CC86DRAFT_404659 [Ophiobolus disseminans]|uniref:Translation elongation factor EF1B beta/delta subunit guanine nucleotide exchange domain-containing protein n=1 Tax=Ophiobolus disseminans TaxID=1469910 RepID=A0A6A7A641_9PLEO|nr:hypothetical protein CC86DRAFT_404659 [Ophiobolus disseminans]